MKKLATAFQARHDALEQFLNDLMAVKNINIRDNIFNSFMDYCEATNEVNSILRDYQKKGN